MDAIDSDDDASINNNPSSTKKKVSSTTQLHIQEYRIHLNDKLNQINLKIIS